MINSHQRKQLQKDQSNSALMPIESLVFSRRWLLLGCCATSLSYGSRSCHEHVFTIIRRRFRCGTPSERDRGKKCPLRPGRPALPQAAAWARRIVACFFAVSLPARALDGTARGDQSWNRVTVCERAIINGAFPMFVACGGWCNVLNPRDGSSVRNLNMFSLFARDRFACSRSCSVGVWLQGTLR